VGLPGVPAKPQGLPFAGVGRVRKGTPRAILEVKSPHIPPEIYEARLRGYDEAKERSAVSKRREKGMAEATPQAWTHWPATKGAAVTALANQSTPPWAVPLGCALRSPARRSPSPALLPEAPSGGQA
jgi:hypothetical protein